MERQAQARIKNLACIIVFFIVFVVLPWFQEDAGLFGERIGVRIHRFITNPGLISSLQDPQYRLVDGVEQITLFPVLGPSRLQVPSRC